MSRRIIQTAVLLVAIFAAVNARADAAFLAAYERAALPEIRPPAPRVEILPNGMRCYLLEDHTIPVARVHVITRAGSIYDPADKGGLAGIAGMLLRSGGAGERDPAAFDAELDRMGAVLSSDMGAEMGTATLVSLSDDLDTALPLLTDMLFSPRLDPERLKVARAKMEEALRREDDEPGLLAAYRFRQLVYGAASPWARRPDSASLGRISVEDVRAFHESFFRADNMILAAAGDFDAAALLRRLRELTARAPTGKVDFPEVPKVALEFEPAEERIARPTSQAFVRLGHLSLRRDNPDKFDLVLLNEILGGGAFKSRLMSDIRTRRGMAYSVWSSISPGTDYGIFTVGLATKANQADEAIKLVREHISRIQKPGDIEKAELAFARESILSGLIFEFDRPFKVVEGRARFFFYGYPDDYWRIYRDRIVAAKLADLTRVADAYLHPEGLRSLIVGPGEKTKKVKGEQR